MDREKLQEILELSNNKSKIGKVKNAMWKMMSETYKHGKVRVFQDLSYWKRNHLR